MLGWDYLVWTASNIIAILNLWGRRKKGMNNQHCFVAPIGGNHATINGGGASHHFGAVLNAIVNDLTHLYHLILSNVVHHTINKTMQLQWSYPKLPFDPALKHHWGHNIFAPSDGLLTANLHSSLGSSTRFRDDVILLVDIHQIPTCQPL